jgi:hypothetical protein
LTLDEEDNDPIVFWSSLVASIGRVVPGFGESVAPALSSVGGLALHSVVARILNELDASEPQIVVVLDDFHRITSRECHDSLALFLERQPASLRLVIATRRDPPLPLARQWPGGRAPGGGPRLYRHRSGAGPQRRLGTGPGRGVDLTVARPHGGLARRAVTSRACHCTALLTPPLFWPTSGEPPGWSSTT